MPENERSILFYHPNQEFRGSLIRLAPSILQQTNLSPVIFSPQEIDEKQFVGVVKKRRPVVVALSLHPTDTQLRDMSGLKVAESLSEEGFLVILITAAFELFNKDIPERVFLYDIATGGIELIELINFIIKGESEE